MDTETRLIERQIVRKFIEVALEDQFALSLDNGGDDLEFEGSTDGEFVMGEMFATDDEKLILTKGGKRGWVRFVYGNDGWDVVADYTMNLQGLMLEVDALTEQLEEKYDQARLPTSERKTMTRDEYMDLVNRHAWLRTKKSVRRIERGESDGENEIFWLAREIAEAIPVDEILEVVNDLERQAESEKKAGQ